MSHTSNPWRFKSSRPSPSESTISYNFNVGEGPSDSINKCKVISSVKTINAIPKIK